MNQTTNLPDEHSPASACTRGLGERAATPQDEPVRIDERLIGRIGVREWGYPTLRIPGQIWRSKEHGTITCLVDAGDDKLSIQTRALEVVPPGAEQQMPDEWRAALWEYVQAWPSSGSGYGPFLAITEAERCDFIRARARELVESDNIGCRLIAHDIGEIASIDYEVPSDGFTADAPRAA